MKKHFIFDLDGTLIDPKVGILRCVNHALETCGMPLLDESGTDPSWAIGPPLREVFRRLAGSNVEESKIERLVSAYRDRFATIGYLENTLYPGIESLLKALSSDGERRLSVATTKSTVYAKMILEHYALDNLFDFVIGSELDGRRSWDTITKRELLRSVLEFYDTDGGLDSYLMIGDRELDIVASKAIGIDSIGVLYGYGSKSEITRAEPTFIVSNVQELEALLTSL